MAVNPLSPGVYIDEIPVLPASIAGVATAVPAFIGYTEKAVLSDGTPVLNIPTRITSLLEYEQIFGKGKREKFDVTIVDSGIIPDNTRTITATFDTGSPGPFVLYQSMVLYFANGGGPCYIVSVDAGFTGSTIDENLIVAGIDKLKNYDEPTLLVFPDAVNVPTAAEYGIVAQSAMAHCALLQDRFAILDVYGNNIASANIANYRSVIGPDNLKYGASYTPFLNTLLNYSINDDNNAGGSQYVYYGSNFTPVTGPIGAFKTSNPSLYNSIIQVINDNFFLTLPSSGAMAGIYARVDRERGVWKAPANVGVRSVIGPSINITNAEQDGLNIDATSGKSINAIRAFTGKGTVVWGARTLAGNDNEWRYINVRRLFIYAEESIKEATEFVVFEPNTANTWVKVIGMIENFLTSLWRDGALAGATTNEAFFVRCGLGTTMTPQDILEGRMIVEVGLAAVRPAEFIILKFMHKLQES